MVFFFFYLNLWNFLLMIFLIFLFYSSLSLFVFLNLFLVLDLFFFLKYILSVYGVSVLLLLVILLIICKNFGFKIVKNIGIIIIIMVKYYDNVVKF